MESSRRKIRHVIFDVDGTLVNNLDLIVRSFNFAVGDVVGKRFSVYEVYSRFGPTLEEMIEEIVPVQDAENAIRKYHAYYKRCFHQYARAYAGIEELVMGLRNASVSVSVYTGSDARMTKTTLEEPGLSNLFSIVVTADDIEMQKPDPDGLIRSMKLMGTSEDETFYLGDAVRDIEASRRARIGSAAALWGFGNEADLKAAHPDFAFETTLDALRGLTSKF